MKNQVTLFVCTVLLASMSTVVSAQSGYRIKSSNGANMRKGPGTSHTATATIPAGANVRVLEKNSDGWYKVEYNGQTGYVASDLVENKSNQQNTSANRSSNDDNSRQQQANGQNDRSSSSNNAHNSNARRDDDSRNNNKKSNNSRTAGKSGSQGSNAGSSSTYNWGIGLRLGDPTGLTVKRYLSNGNALEVSLGRSARWGYNYDEDDFYKNDRYRDKDYYHFAGYKGGASTALQVHYLWQKPIRSAQGLSWYFGLGGQARFTTIRYYYYYNEGDWDKDWWRWNYVEERRTDLDLGLDGTIGLEYTFPRAPLSIFGDANLFMEIVDRPLVMFGQGGVGIRYNF